MPFSVELVCCQTRTRSRSLDASAMPSMTWLDDSVRFAVEATRTGALTATEVVRPRRRSVWVDGMAGLVQRSRRSSSESKWDHNAAHNTHGAYSQVSYRCPAHRLTMNTAAPTVQWTCAAETTIH